ncbi:MAG: helix-turn-helix domain-containing protein [Thermocrispum sp.]
MADIVRIHPERTRPVDPDSGRLWRERLGQTLREARVQRNARLVDVAERAGISPQYLSEIERGRKEPSSEMIAAVTGALGVEFDQVLVAIVGRSAQLRLSKPSRRPSGPVLMAVA